MKILIIIITVILMSCSKQPIEDYDNIPLPKGIDTLPSFVVKAPVKVFATNSVKGDIKYCIEQAVYNWDSLGVVSFEMVNSLVEATTIVSIGDTGNDGAWGALPLDYLHPGSEIVISKYSRLNQAQMINAVIHELGHNVGFRHIYSNLSVMTPVNRNWGGWRKFDLSFIKNYYK